MVEYAEAHLAAKAQQVCREWTVRRSWNHNIEDHRVVLAAVSPSCSTAVDVGCGEGRLTRTLAPHAQRVVGLDVDADIIAAAQKEPILLNVTFVVGDIMTAPYETGTCDLVCTVATLHHLPLEPALARFAEMLAPGGVLVVIGLYRSEGVADVAFEAMSFLASHAKRRFFHFEAMNAPTCEPQETLREIKKAAARLLPGSILKRHLFFRYSLVWRKPC